MWSVITNGLSRYKLYLLAGAAVLAVGAGLYGAGYLVGSRNEARIVTKTLYVPVKEIQEVQVRNVDRERELAENLQLAVERNKTLQHRLSLVPVNSCPVSPVAVGVLNEAITGSPQADPAGIPADSTTTVTDLTDWSLTAIGQYNEVSTRYNALIDWVEEELIEPQRNDK